MKKNPFLLSSIAILIFFVCSMTFLVYMGRGSRIYGDSDVPILLVNNTTDVYSLWKKAGLNGRVVIHMGRYLHLLRLSDSALSKLVLESRINAGNIIDEYERALSYKNFLRIALEKNLARSIYYMLPQDIYMERYKILEEGDAQSVILHQMGSKTVITNRIPPLKEPVILNIDASYFSSSDVTNLVSDLKRSGLTVDFVTFCLSEDNPEVNAIERERLKEAADFFLNWRKVE